jgi:hypothetical protein
MKKNRTAKRFSLIIGTAILAAGLVFVPSMLAQETAKPLGVKTEEKPVFSVKVTDAEAGETVIMQGQQFIADGALVRVIAGKTL